MIDLFYRHRPLIVKEINQLIGSLRVHLILLPLHVTLTSFSRRAMLVHFINQDFAQPITSRSAVLLLFETWSELSGIAKSVTIINGTEVSFR